MDAVSTFIKPRLCAYAAIVALILTIGWTPPNAVAASDPGQVIGWGVYEPVPQPFPTTLHDPGALSGKSVTALDIGQSICALADGHVYCWGGGMNAHFPGSGSQVPVLIDFGSLTGKIVDRLSVGSSMACAVAEGRAHCWGGGPLGNGQSFLPAPVQVSLTGKTVQAVSVGDETACLVAEGKLYCWGYAGVGGGVAIPQAVDPSGVLAGKTVTDVSVGPSGSACVIADGSSYCAQQGTSFAPVAGALGGTTAIAVGDSHSCLVAKGQAYCWGRNSRGQLGNGTTISTTQPKPVSTLAALRGRTVQAITVGKEHTCALAEGGVFCWGDNTLGQLGAQLPGGTYSAVPVWTTPGHLVAAGLTENCSAHEQTVSCWGWGATKMQLKGEAFALNVRATWVERNCAVIDTRVQCWKESIGAPAPTPVKGLPSGPVTDLSTGTRHACAVIAGRAYCWGANTFGQLGNGTRKRSTSAVRVTFKGSSRGPVTDISAGRFHTCAVVGRNAYCWGRGSLGRAPVQRSAKALRVPVPGKAVTAIAVGAAEPASANYSGDYATTDRTYTCAVSDARLYCWGWNTYGQLGTGNGRSTWKPKLIATGGLRNKRVQAVSLDPASPFSPRVCAIAAGRVYCWGRDNGGVPTLLGGLPDTRVSQLVVGSLSACALVRGDIWCWGGHTPGWAPLMVNTDPLSRGRAVQLSASADRGIWQS